MKWVDEFAEELSKKGLDYDAAGNLVALEILDASRKVENPAHLDYRVAV